MIFHYHRSILVTTFVKILHTHRFFLGHYCVSPSRETASPQHIAQLEVPAFGNLSTFRVLFPRCPQTFPSLAGTADALILLAASHLAGGCSFSIPRKNQRGARGALRGPPGDPPALNKEGPAGTLTNSTWRHNVRSMLRIGPQGHI